MGAQVAAQVALAEQPLDGVEPRLDGGGIEQGTGEARRQQARAAGADGAVDGGEQRAIAGAVLGALDLETGAGGRVDGHGVGLAGAAWGVERRRAAALRGLQMGGDQAEGRDLGAGQGAETVEGLDAIEPLEPGLGRGRFGQGLGHGLDQAAGGFQCSGEVGFGEQAVWDQDLGRLQGGQGGGHPVSADPHHLDLAGRQLNRRDRRLAGAQGDGGQAVGAARVEQAVLGQGAGRDHPHHIAADDGFGAALPRLGRILHLLADGDLEAGADQLGQIGLGGVHRHPGHGDGLAAVRATGGQLDAEGGGGLLGVLKKQLVEVAHAEEDQGVRLARLGLEELRHDRAGAGGVDRNRGCRGVHRRGS